MKKRKMTCRSVRFETIDLEVCKRLGLDISEICRKALKHEIKNELDSIDKFNNDRVWPNVGPTE